MNVRRWTTVTNNSLEAASPLDRIDLRILNCLQGDGRIANLKLAETVGLSPTAVLAREMKLP